MATATIIDGKQFAARLRAGIAAHVTRLKAEYGLTPGLAVVLVGDDPASQIYVRNKGLQARDALSLIHIFLKGVFLEQGQQSLAGAQQARCV